MTPAEWHEWVAAWRERMHKLAVEAKSQVQKGGEAYKPMPAPTVNAPKPEHWSDEGEHDDA